MFKSIGNITLILLFIGIACLVILLYQNRSSPKLQETAVVVLFNLITALATTAIFVTSGEEVKKTFYTPYFIRNSSNEILNFIGTPVIGGCYINQSITFSNYIKRKTDTKQTDITKLTSDYKALIDIHSLAILNHLFKFHSQSWLVEKEYPDTPIGTLTTWTSKVKEVQHDIDKHTKNSLELLLKENVFYLDFQPTFPSLSLPKDTKVYYRTLDDHSKEFRFYKPFCFDIRIQIELLSGMPGLGEVSYLIGLKERNKPQDRNDNESKEFNTIVLKTTCKASFPMFRYWNPSVVLYREWATNLFQELYKTLDWSVIKTNFRNYQSELADEVIVKQLSK